MDFRHIQLSRVVLACLVAVCTISVCFAQVNFSPNWGKRGSGLVGGGRSQDTCKPSMDSLMYLYKLIQDEAQKIVDCEKFGN